MQMELMRNQILVVVNSRFKINCEYQSICGPYEPMEFEAMPEYKNLIPRVIKKKQRNDQNETKRVQGNDGKTLCMYCGKGYKRVGGHEPYCNNNPNKRKLQ